MAMTNFNGGSAPKKIAKPAAKSNNAKVPKPSQVANNPASVPVPKQVNPIQQLINRFDNVNSGPVVPTLPTGGHVGPTGTSPTGPTGTGTTSSTSGVTGTTGSVASTTGSTSSVTGTTGSTGSGDSVTGTTGSGGFGPTLSSTYVDNNGNQIGVMSDGNTKTLGPSQTGAATSATRQNAFDLLKDQFTSFGVLRKDSSGNYDSASQGLLGTIKSLILGGAGPDTASLTLQQSPAYEARFSGNKTRLANGLKVLSPAEYIATENSYDQVLKTAGFPAGYSNQGKWADFIANDMSPAELKDRTDVAAKSLANKDPFYTSTLQGYYGLSAGDMIAHALDPQAALPLLQRQQQSAQFGAAAARQGLSVSSNVAQQYAALGISQGQAEQGFQQVGSQLANDQKLANIYGGQGTQFGVAADQQSALQAATFGGPGAADAQLRLKKLQQQETNAFSGSAGVAKGSLEGDLAGTF